MQTGEIIERGDDWMRERHPILMFQAPDTYLGLALNKPLGLLEVHVAQGPAKVWISVGKCGRG